MNPATGDRDFTAFMSPEKEVQIGREEHPKIIAQFGGVYDDPKVTAYVNRIGQQLAEVSELPDLDFTFTVLNDDIVNASLCPVAMSISRAACSAWPTRKPSLPVFSVMRSAT